jgi:cardiolipin synthase
VNTYHRFLYLFLGGSLCLLYGWLAFASVTPPLPTPAAPTLFYSNQLRQDLKLVFCRAMKEAKESIYLQIYALTDPVIKKLLHQKEKRGIAPTILFDPSASGRLEKRFAHAHPLHSKGLMHRKILVVDGAQVFLGSANLTTQSLHMHDNLVVGLYHPPLAHFLKTEEAPSSYFFTIGGEKAELWLLPSKQALQRTLEALYAAKKRIRIAMFTFTHPELVDALISLHQRGISISLALDFYTGRGASSKALKRLQDERIPISLSRGTQLLHHKWALIDDQTLIIGSANWTEAAFEENADCFLILHSLNHSQKKFMKKLWKTVEWESDLL